MRKKSDFLLAAPSLVYAVAGRRRVGAQRGRAARPGDCKSAEQRPCRGVRAGLAAGGWGERSLVVLKHTLPAKRTTTPYTRVGVQKGRGSTGEGLPHWFL